MAAANTKNDVTWYSAPLKVPDQAMASYPSSDPPSGLSSQLIIDDSPLPEKPMWSLNQTEPIPPKDKIYRVLDPTDPTQNTDIHDIGREAILFNNNTKIGTKIIIQDLKAQFKLGQTKGTGFKLTFTYAAPSSSGGGKSLYFKTKSTRKSSRRKYFKRKSSKRRIRTKSKYRRQ